MMKRFSFRFLRYFSDLPAIRQVMMNRKTDPFLWARQYIEYLLHNGGPETS
jgi:hypothetical protein